MRIEIVPENDYDLVELGIMTPEQLGEKMAKKNIEELRKKIKRI